MYLIIIWNKECALTRIVMLGKVAAHQERERWRSRMSTVVAGCHILRAKVLRYEQGEGSDAAFEILVDNISGTWKVLKDKLDFRRLISQLDVVFPVEGGARGHERILPTAPSELSSLTFWQSARKLVERLVPKLDDYMRELLFLPPYISRSLIVLDFLLPSHAESPLVLSILDNESGGGKEKEDYAPSTSHSYSSSKIIPDALFTGFIRIKVRCSSEMAVVEYDLESSFQTFLKCAQKKFQMTFDPAVFSYKDPAGDTVLVEDDEDLQSAVALLGRKLVLNA